MQARPTRADHLGQSAQPPLVRLALVVDLGLGLGVETDAAHLAHGGTGAALTPLSLGPRRQPLPGFVFLFFFVFLLLLTLVRKAWTLSIWGRGGGKKVRLK